MSQKYGQSDLEAHLFLFWIIHIILIFAGFIFILLEALSKFIYLDQLNVEIMIKCRSL